METVVDSKICRQCQSGFSITDRDLQFYDKASPIFDGQKFQIPSPTLCPSCRQQRRLSWRNETKLYRRTCDISGKDVISIYSPDKKDFVIYNQDDWWNGKWNPLDYGRNFDFTKTFFEQYSELQKIVPRIAVLNGLSENTQYANHAYHNKNSYMMFASGYCEESYYCINVGNGEQCVDCYRVFNSQHIYEGLDCENCNNCHYIQRCKDCADVYISLDCDNCKHCIGCKNLKNKEYYVFNQAVTQEQFEKIKKDFTHDEQKRVEIFEKAKQVKYEYPSKCLTLIQCENTQNSNQCFNSENVSNSFDIANCRDVKYTYEMLLGGANDCYDYDIWGENASLMYEVHCSGNAHQILFCNVVWGGNKVFYCDNCLVEVRDCFGCIGLHENEQYCILNKQYTKESYEKTVAQIIKHMQKTGEWGEFFPSSLSPFGYNETHAQEYYPITGPQPNLLPKGEGVKGIIKDNQFIPLPLGELEGGISLLPLGEAGGGIFNWSNYEIPFPKVEKIIPANKLPHDIHQIPDDILNWAIECEVSKKPFRIIQQELEFYKTHALPLPKRSPEQRYRDRFILREPRKVFSRKCDKCSIEIQTTIATTRPEKVYCEGCYNKEIY